MNIIYLTGLFTDSLYEEIKDNSIGSMQNAADVLQKNYLEGFIKNEEVKNIDVINLPYIGGYPGSYKKVYFVPSVKNESHDNVNIINVGFLNIKGIKNISRLFKSFFYIYKAAKLRKEKETHLICYSMHMPFLISCYLNSLLNNKLKYYIIIPDLPEYMQERKGLTEKLYKLINTISYFIVNRSDGISVITEKMKKKFNSNLNSVVIEGIAALPKNIDINDVTKAEYKYILYSGTLDKRYGIRDLVDSYIISGIDNVKLIICGSGDDSKYVFEKSQQYTNIIYLGLVDRCKAVELQKNAYILVNPRGNDSDFTKYSFPSKTIEYMMSGVPVLMYKLDGIPNEYDELFLRINTKQDFSDMIRFAVNLPDNELKAIGKKAQLFILKNKSSQVQTKKLISMISGKFKNV